MVEARGFVLARVGHALVDVQLTARPDVAPLALTLERALGVEAFPRMFTWVGTCKDGLMVYFHFLSEMVVHVKTKRAAVFFVKP